MTLAKVIACAALALGRSLLFAAVRALDSRRSARREQRNREAAEVRGVAIEPPPSGEPLSFVNTPQYRPTQRMPQWRQ